MTPSTPNKTAGCPERISLDEQMGDAPADRPTSTGPWQSVPGWVVNVEVPLALVPDTDEARWILNLQSEVETQEMLNDPAFMASYAEAMGDTSSDVPWTGDEKAPD